MIETAYRTALAATGGAFEQAERELRDGGPAALAFLEAQLAEAHGVDALVTRALITRVSGNAGLEAAFALMDELELAVGATVKRYPSPETLATRLWENLDPALAPALAAYLVKLGNEWPAWKTVGVMMYLGAGAGPEVSDALLTFALRTAGEHYRKVAAAALVSSGDAGTLAKLETVLEAAGPAGDVLAEAADALRSRLGGADPVA